MLRSSAWHGICSEFLSGFMLIDLFVQRPISRLRISLPCQPRRKKKTISRAFYSRLKYFLKIQFSDDIIGILRSTRKKRGVNADSQSSTYVVNDYEIKVQCKYQSPDQACQSFRDRHAIYSILVNPRFWNWERVVREWDLLVIKKYVCHARMNVALEIDWPVEWIYLKT